MRPQNKRKSLRTKEKQMDGRFAAGAAPVLIDGCRPTLHDAAVGLHATPVRQLMMWRSVGGLLLGTRGSCGCGVPHHPGSSGKAGIAGIAHDGVMMVWGPLPLPPSGSTGKVAIPPCTVDAASRSSTWVQGKSLMNSEVMTVLLEE
jgi:hypothetical protein